MLYPLSQNKAYLVRQERAAHKGGASTHATPILPIRSRNFKSIGLEWRLMIGLRHPGIVFCTILAMLLFVADRQLARGQDHHAGAGKTAAASCRRAAFRVVVDVGHTVDVPGALSARGTPEYTFNLQLAQDIKQALADAGFDSAVLLVTAAAPPEGLVERALTANRMPADLFIAIHHDSVPDNLLQTWDYEGEQNHFNDDYPGYAIFISNDNHDRAGSLAFGHLLGKELQARGLQYTPHYTLPLMGHRRRELIDADAGVYRYDALIVLRLTRMPAVLLEAGSIVNRAEELQLAGPERRALESSAVVAAVDEFCASRTRPAAAKPAASAR
jgi:N-acetylmuramoyl-L-alanine amidase